MNRSTKIIVSIFGILLGISGINHGFFAALQGFTPTSALIFESIGETNRMWLYGFETAFTVIPNYFISGILSIITSLAIMVWSIAFVHKKNGSVILILLYIFLFMVGGGLGQVIFFLPLWGVSTCINNPLIWWRKVLSEKIRQILGKIWPFSLTAVSMMFLIALEIAVFGFVPGVTNPEHKLFICWSILAAAFLLFIITFVSGLARDIQRNYRMSEA